MTTTQSITRIAKHNDRLRACLPAFPHPHRFMVTTSVAALSPGSLSQLIVKVQSFGSFTPDNDPHLEHDFGSIDHEGERYFWKFDYYDEDLQCFQEDGIRVLTLMHSSDY